MFPYSCMGTLLSYNVLTCLLTLAPLGAQRWPYSLALWFFSQIAPEVLEFRFETCHTSPGNNFTFCVKKIRIQVIIGQP